MSNYRENFKRKETKYKLDSNQRNIIESGIRKHGLSLTQFGKSTINSIYLDTPEREVISRSLAKPLYKEKVRLRWYGNCPIENAKEVFIELKKKFKGIVYKRRVAVSVESAIEYIQTGVPDSLKLVAEEPEYMDMQILREVKAVITRHDGMSASAAIRYDRSPYEDGEALGLRITFDTRLFGADADSNNEKELIAAGYSVMEIKCNGAYPLWLVSLLNEAKAYPHSFSKYGELYLAER